MRPTILSAFVSLALVVPMSAAAVGHPVPLASATAPAASAPEAASSDPVAAASALLEKGDPRAGAASAKSGC